jgi:aryl-alcohol dehydrogenase-like predicted oxidoreductase
MTYGEQTSAADAQRQMDMAVAAGINIFDTAELYAIPPRPETYGATENIIGDWLKTRGNRDKIVIATKIAGPAPHMPWIRGANVRLGKAEVQTALNASLKRLKTDYIDLYQIHWPDRAVNNFGKLGFDADAVSNEAARLEETLTALSDEIKAGRIRHIGFSNETPWGVMHALRLFEQGRAPRVQSVQNAYNLLNRVYEIGLAEISMQENVSLLGYAPLAAGVLTGKYLNGTIPKGSRWDIDARSSRYKKPRMEDAVRAYLDIAAKHGIDPVHMAIAFARTRPFMTSVIIGATLLEQLEHILQATALTLNDDVLADIRAVHAVNPNPCP